MDLVSLLAERAITEAMQRGEFDTSAMHGAPLPDLDEQRRPGWWTERFVARERSRIRREEIEGELGVARAALWRSSSLDALREAVTRANRSIVAANAGLEPAHRLPLIDVHEAIQAWRRTRPGAGPAADRHDRTGGPPAG